MPRRGVGGGHDCTSLTDTPPPSQSPVDDGLTAATETGPPGKKISRPPPDLAQAGWAGSWMADGSHLSQTPWCAFPAGLGGAGPGLLAGPLTLTPTQPDKPRCSLSNPSSPSLSLSISCRFTRSLIPTTSSSSSSRSSSRRLLSCERAWSSFRSPFVSNRVLEGGIAIQFPSAPRLLTDTRSPSSVGAPSIPADTASSKASSHRDSPCHLLSTSSYRILLCPPPPLPTIIFAHDRRLTKAGQPTCLCPPSHDAIRRLLRHERQRRRRRRRW